MKVAIVHDDLMRRGGAEKVARTISDMYPDAPIYTLCYRPELTYPEFKGRDIRTSWFQFFARNEKLMKWLFFPLGIWAMRAINLKGYDLVIMSTTYCAKYVKVDSGAKVFAYCYTPFRLAWNPQSYNVYKDSKGILKGVFNLVVNWLKRIDLKGAERVDYFVAMTSETSGRIVDSYGFSGNIPIVNPAVELGNYKITNDVSDYYLLVSRFEPYKKVDLVIEAFNENGKDLIIVGKGSQEKKLKAMAKGNIVFKQNLSNTELADLYQGCKAFIFPQYEDYGLTPLEANAAGRSVIAYAKGGVLDTMIPYQDNPNEATAYFFYDQSVNSLNAALKESENINFDPLMARKNAERFSESRFKKELEEFITSKMA